jgi:hypothetical protein
MLTRPQAREHGRHHFTLEGSQDLPAKLKDLYEAQLEVLSAPMLADDLTEDVSSIVVVSLRIDLRNLGNTRRTLHRQ